VHRGVHEVAEPVEVTRRERVSSFGDDVVGLDEELVESSAEIVGRGDEARNLSDASWADATASAMVTSARPVSVFHVRTISTQARDARLYRSRADPVFSASTPLTATTNLRSSGRTT